MPDAPVCAPARRWASRGTRSTSAGSAPLSAGTRDRRSTAVTGIQATGRATALVVRVTIEGGEPFAGSMSIDEGVHELAFSGWLGFVETLSLLRRRAESER